LRLKSDNVLGFCGVKVKLVTFRSKTAPACLTGLLAIMELMSCRVAISVLELLGLWCYWGL